MPPTLHRSPSDLSTHLACAHATVLDRARTAGRIAAPSGHDPGRALMVERGRLHEARYVQSLAAEGLSIADLHDADAGDAAATAAAMCDGADAIVQAPLSDGAWRGRADVLRRVARASAIAGWSYEVVDTKLSRHTRVGTILQLSLYSKWVAHLQGAAPEFLHVVTPGEPFVVQHHRVADYAAYVRHAERRLETALAIDLDDALAASRPEPCDHCDVCRWWLDCKNRWVAEDHPTLVAGLSRTQRRELSRVGIGTLTELATRPDLLPAKPEIGAPESYVRAHRQARVQWRGRAEGHVVQWLEGEPAALGVARLPAASAQDLFLDLESDPFVGTTGREYLFGTSWALGRDEPYRAIWALDEAGERAAFEATIDEIARRRAIDPDMHVYHFGAYEPAALRRLSGRHPTRSDAIDELLRHEVLVDLHRIVKTTLRASVERYSLKDLEPVFGFSRALPLQDARAALRRIEAALELDVPEAIDDALRRKVQGYNEDDCRATRALRDWLEGKRAALEREHGITLPRPVVTPKPTKDETRTRYAASDELAAALRATVPQDAAARSDDDRARLLLADLLGFHRREESASWWEFFRLRDLREDEREDEREAIAGLRHVDTSSEKRSLVYRYQFVPQETAVGPGDTVYDEDGNRRGEVTACDRITGEVAIKISTAKAAELQGHPTWVFAHDHVSPGAKPDALQRLANSVLAGTRGDTWHAARSLLLREPPRLRGGVSLSTIAADSAQARAEQAVLALDRSVLAIQGPPGTGKTHAGAAMIVRLVQEGRRVGVTALSHAVIRNLLDQVLERAAEQGVHVDIGVKPDAGSSSVEPLHHVKDDAAAAALLRAGQVHVVGGTPWLWSSPRLEAAVDVLFVDEAGQLALADVLAVAGAGTSLVLLGDPQQLTQPHKAVHPDGSDVSALAHVLGGAATIDPAMGIFLEETWRMPPPICALTSELFYDGRLHGRPDLSHRRLDGTGSLGLDGAGLWHVPVLHAGRSVRAPEEVDVVDSIVARLLAGATWTDFEGNAAGIFPDDILVIAPFNAQVTALRERLDARGVRVGTVDKFQGQQAAVVLFSATSSTAADVPRGMAFLYSAHRFNVATSRAKVACLVVATDALLSPDCRTVDQLRLANAWCRFAELAGRIEGVSTV